MNDLFYDDDNLPTCPACYSERVMRLTDDEKTTALGLYNIYDYIGQIDKLTNEYRCDKIGYSW